MDEIEVKVIGADFELIKVRLEKLGATKERQARLATYYLDTPDEKLKNKKSVLRVRNSRGKAKLTYKETNSDAKISVYNELETNVESSDKVIEIFKALGFMVTNKMEKTRTAYRFDDAEIVFDKLEGDYSFVPLYMEIEGKDKKAVEKYISKLGIDKKNMKAWNTFEVIDFYTKQK